MKYPRAFLCSIHHSGRYVGLRTVKAYPKEGILKNISIINLTSTIAIERIKIVAPEINLENK